jgi:mRNA-degrading endonuclease RelE of RelBE toxin-antitoxin system
MTWRILFRPEIETDILEASTWYESKQQGLGLEFFKEINAVWDSLLINPLLNSRRHPTKNIRWRYPERFPYRIIYEVDEIQNTILVIAILHAARHDQRWKSLRIE